MPTTNVTFGRDFFRPLRGLGEVGGDFPTARAVGYDLSPATRAGGTPPIFLPLRQPFPHGIAGWGDRPPDSLRRTLHLMVISFAPTGLGRVGAVFPTARAVGYRLSPATRAGGRSALLGFVVRLQSYDYFSSSVPFFQIPDSLRDFTQPVTLVDDQCYLSGLHELVHDDQVLFPRFRQKHNQVLAHQP